MNWRTIKRVGKFRITSIMKRFLKKHVFHLDSVILLSGILKGIKRICYQNILISVTLEKEVKLSQLLKLVFFCFLIQFRIQITSVLITKSKKSRFCNYSQAASHFLAKCFAQRTENIGPTHPGP